MPSLVCVDDEPAVVTTTTYAPEWREKTVIFRLPTLRVLWLDGWQYGPLVVHATWDDAKARPYVVAHLHTLLVLCRWDTTEQAVAAVERLWREAGRELSAREPDARRMPADVVQWCKENQ